MTRMQRVSERQKCSIVVSGTQPTTTMKTTSNNRKRSEYAALCAAAVAVFVCLGGAPTACAALGLNESVATATSTGSPSTAADSSSATFAGGALLANATAAKWSRTGNELWDGLVNECMASPTVACFQKNVYHYLDDTLRPGDVNVTNGFRFVRNRLEAADLRQFEGSNGAAEAADADVEDNTVDDENAQVDQGRAADSPLEEVTDALAGRGVDFLMMHNMEMQLPDTLFDGATVRISPRSFDGKGALLHFELVPAAKKLRDAGRLLFKPLKKLKKLFRNKLLLSFLAIVLIVKLIKVKLFWILPFIVGVGAAKKLMLKVILFLFPALAHIFKLCSYYHKNYKDGTKYHQHNHQINHLHSVVPTWFNEPHHEHEHEHGHQHSISPYAAHEPELIYTSPPKGHPSEYLHGGPPLFQQHPQDWELSGPGLGSEYISDRNTHVNSFKSKLDEFNEISSLGGGVHGTTTRAVVAAVYPKPVPAAIGHAPPPHRPAPAAALDPYARVPANRVITTSQYHRQVFAPKHPAPVVVQQPPVPPQYATVTDEKMLREAQRLQAKQLEALRIQAEQKLLLQQQTIQPQQSQQQIFHSPQSSIANDATSVIDTVYSPILQKVDKIMQQLKFNDEPCKERLICSMYKSPQKYSPYSNFVSAELSRDMSELPKPTTSNAAVVRFYRYVQAARDGQDQRDCLQIYGQCTLNTEN